MCLCTRALRRCGRLESWYQWSLAPFLFPPSSDLPWPFLLLIYFVLLTFYALWYRAMFSLLVVQVGPLLVSPLTKSSPNLRGWAKGTSSSPAFLGQHLPPRIPGTHQVPRGCQGTSLTCPSRLPVEGRNLWMWFLSCHSRKRNTVGSLIPWMKSLAANQNSQGTGSHSVLCPYLKGMAGKSWLYSNF